MSDWKAGYINELEEVTRRRLRALGLEEIEQMGVRHKAVRLRNHELRTQKGWEEEV